MNVLTDFVKNTLLNRLSLSFVFVSMFVTCLFFIIIINFIVIIIIVIIVIVTIIDFSWR